MSKYLALWLTLMIAGSASAQFIATTDPLEPQAERAKLKVPKGFDIQLVASEPDIYKPMNMKFDAHGRMWVTSSIEYPFPAQEGQGRDRITILSDFGPDGRAGKVQQFAEDLSIPIGICPLPDGSCIVWSIPNIWRLYDTDGDGKADKRDILFSGIGYTDTHGNQNAFTYWVDGWVYACHGFANQSKIIKGTNGPVALEMQSGNTYRFKPDGSEIEQITWGQVNPFGMTFDPLGNAYTADCHSRPLTMLIRGAHFQSFGRPHDGLGYAPEMINHDHGSTGISGIAYYAAEQFPKEYQQCLYLGNVITNRVHRDAIQWTGATPKADTKEDFIVSEDPWFRPVDIQLGPDGAVYVADFYNRIIGHYEVPLDHPQRDKHRGRIWRVVKKDQGETPRLNIPDIANAKTDRLLELIGHSNFTVRMLAVNSLTQQSGVKFQTLILKEVFGDGKALIPNVLKKEEPRESHAGSRQRAMAAWALERTGNLGGTTFTLLKNQSQTEPELQTHLLRILAERDTLGPEEQEFIVQCLQPAHTSKVGPLQSTHVRPAYVTRMAAEALGRHPDAANIRPLLDLWQRTPKEDEVLTHTVKVALRDTLKQGPAADALVRIELTPEQRALLVQVAPAVPNAQAASFLLDAVEKNPGDKATLSAAMPHIARYISQQRLDDMVAFARKEFAGQSDYQMSLLQLIRKGLDERGAQPTAAMRAWAAELPPTFLNGESVGWTHLPIEGLPASANPWSLEVRNSTDNAGPMKFLSSLPYGEQRTGLLRSKPFTIPAKLSFYLSGHNGLPGSNTPVKNRVRLVLAENKQTLAEALPPRNDVAHPVTWDLASHAGKQGYIEVVDADTAGAYAWLAIGRFDPAVVTVPMVGPADVPLKQVEALQLVGAFGLTDFKSRTTELLADRSADVRVRNAAAEALSQLDRPLAVSMLGKILADAGEPPLVRAGAADLLGRVNNDASRKALLEAVSSAPQSEQQFLAMSLVGSRAGGELLLDAISQGKASARLLQQQAILQRMRAARVADLDNRVMKLTEGLLPADERITQLIASRREGYLKSSGDGAAGKAVFQKVCAACHQVGSEGNRIGPTLDGVGNRGLDRLLEDILDPNRNVDGAFRFNTVTLKDGQFLSGMPLRTEGQVLILADATGKENPVPLANIANRTELNLSLMPQGLAEALSDKEFMDLIAYLMAQKAAQ